MITGHIINIWGTSAKLYGDNASQLRLIISIQK